MGEVIKLPSNYQVGEEVCLSFGTGPLIPKCHITKVIFTRSKILYDVEIQIYEPGETNDGYLPMCVGHTRIHSVDSAFVKPFNHVSNFRDHNETIITKWNPRSEYPDTNRLVVCRYIGFDTTDTVGPQFIARVKWDGGGMEWFDEQGIPIRDAEKFEWTEIKTQGKDLFREQLSLKHVQDMCIESLSHDEYKDWFKILNIIRTRRKHA